jgi:tetratricopeptide (TPR) repeat protein
MPYDLFISYARRDDERHRISTLVERLSRDFQLLAGRPLNVFFDAVEIHGMEDWRHRILQALRESRLLLSPNYLASQYCEWEFNEYVNNEVGRALAGQGVAPVYLTDVPRWQDNDFEIKCDEWVKELRRRQSFDLRAWPEPGGHASDDAAVAAFLSQLNIQISNRIRQGERAEERLGNVDAHNPHFVGRSDELRRLREAVGLRKIGVLAAIHGLGGMGKTALALEYAHAYGGEYGGGRWEVRCEGREDLAAALTTLASALHVEFTEAEKIDLELQLQRILAELRDLANTHEPHRCLLILDNVDKPKLLEPAQTQRLPSDEWLDVIATTRLGEYDLFSQQRDRAFVAVDEMPEADALNLIESYQPGGHFIDETEREAAREIVRLLEGFTLAIEAAAVFLGQFAYDVTCAGFLQRLKKEGLAGLEIATSGTNEGVRHGEIRLTATLQPTLERLTEQELLALRYAALLPADQIALPWIRSLVAAQYELYGKDAEPGYPDIWQRLLRSIFSLRLWQATGVVNREGRPLIARMHRLLQELMRDAAGEQLDSIKSTVIEHVKTRAAFIWEGWLQHEHRWEIKPLAACAREWREDDQVGAYLAHLASGPLRQLGNFAEAEALRRDALAIGERRFGPDHPEVAAYLNNLAQVLQDTNRLKEAEPLMKRALAIDEESFGPDHPNVAIDLNNLAQVLQDTNRLTEAEPLMKRALAIDEQSFGPDHPEVAGDLNNLAQLLKDTNRLKEAEPLMRRVVEIFEMSLGANHPNVATALNNLAQLLKATNRVTEAEPLMKRALAIDEQSFGPDHPKFAIRLNNLASLLLATKRLTEAEPLMKRALAIDEKSFGPDHPSVALRLNNLAQLLQATNRLTEAEPLMKRALAIDEQSFGPDHPTVALRLNNLAQLLKATNRQAEAAALMRRHLEIFVRFTATTGHEHPLLRAAIGNYTALLQQMGYSEEQVNAELDKIGSPFGMKLGSLT